MNRKTETSGHFVVMVYYQKTNRLLVEAFKNTNTIYQVIQTSTKKFNLNLDENNQFVLRYAHQVLDPMVTLEKSRIPQSAELILENVAHISANPIVKVTLTDIEDGVVNSGKFKENENLWNVAESLLPSGKYINPNKMSLSCFDKRITGREELKATMLNEVFTGSNIDLRLHPTYSDESVKAASLPADSSQSSKKKLTKKRKKSKRTKTSEDPSPLVGIRGKVNTINKSTKASTLNQIDDVYYLGRRHGIAFFTEDGGANKSLMSVHSSAKNYVTEDTQLHNPPELNNEDNMELTINFPNSISFKALFHKDEKVKDVLEFIRPYLNEKKLPFYLYTLNPKLVMPSDKVLKDINFMPPYNQLQISFGRRYNPTVNYLKSDIIASLNKPTFKTILSQFFNKH